MTEIRVDGEPYTVIGLGERQGTTLGQSQDDYVVVPLTAYQKTYGSTKTVSIAIKAGVGAQMDRAMDEARIDALLLPVATFPPKLNGDRNTTPAGAATWIGSGLHWPAAVVPMGYTYEVDLHFWMKRAWALSGAWGDRAFHLKRIDDAVIGGAMPIGPDQTFAAELSHA